jgi:CBS domain-containing protein
MTSDPITASGNTTLPEAYWLIVDNNIRRLLVVDKNLLSQEVQRDKKTEAETPEEDK